MEQFGDGVPREFIVVKVYVLEIGSLLYGLHKHFGTFIIDVVIGKVKFSQGVALLNNDSDLLGTD